MKTVAARATKVAKNPFFGVLLFGSILSYIG
jgi:hypothetical protein